MPQLLTAYRVFIASPGGLVPERQAFRDAIHAYNEMDAISRGVLFIPLGWEQTLPGMGRPQSLINEELNACDYFLIMLWDRWGSSSGDDRYTSATNEEFDVARACWRNPRHCLREIAAFFKAIEPRHMSDPGEQLRPVLDFRRRLEQTKELHFATFDDLSSFQWSLQRLLAKWVRDHEQGKTGKTIQQSVASVPSSPEIHPALVPTSSVTAGLTQLGGSTVIVEQAEQLALQGRLTDAEILFARAVVKDNDPAVGIQYARFLRRLGRYSQAQALLEGILERPGQEEHWKAGACNYLGMLFRDRGEYEEAEKALNRARSFGNHPQAKETTIAACNNLGQLFRDRGDLATAERLHQEAARHADQPGFEAFLANAYGNLAHISLLRGDWDDFELMNKKAIDLTAQIRNDEGMAIALRNQGMLLIERNRLSEAEQILNRSLELAGRIGRQKSVADVYLTLARVRAGQGKFSESEELAAKGIETNERIGRRKGIGRGFGLLGEIQHMRGEDAQAERSLLRAIDTAREVGDKMCIANCYLSLGKILSRRGESTAARLLLADARQLYERMGMRIKVQEVQTAATVSASTS